MRKAPRIRTIESYGMLGVALLFVVLAAVAGGVQKSSSPRRCPEGSSMIETRCCAPGQSERQGTCQGTPRSCPEGFRVRAQGCVVQASRVRIEAGSLRVGPGDWEAQGLVQPKNMVVASPYRLDSVEVTVEAWNFCAAKGACSPVIEEEPGLPVRGIGFARAEQFCAWMGGQLPTEEQWVLAAAGAQARRYPWGETGAVCRRADWGRWQGPCAQGGHGPDWAGLHAEDRTPEGIVGFSGGVAEWVRGSDGPAVRGGSWKSRLAAELRTWRRESRNPELGYDDVGFRCVYDE